MYEIRASACCLEARMMLADLTSNGVGCLDPAPAPCRGFTGDCSDLPLQFNELPPDLNPFSGYVCHQARRPPLMHFLFSVPFQFHHSPRLCTHAALLLRRAR